MRRLAARAHLWGGLLLGPVVLVMGLSGAALVFRPELDALPTVTPSPPHALDAIVAAARITEPGGEVHALRIPPRADQPYRVEIRHGTRQVNVVVNPVTLRVLDSRAPERSVLDAVHALHAGFHAGRPGALAVGVAGVALVLESLAGLGLYRQRLLRRGHGARRRSRGLHRVIGGASLAIGLVLGVSGVALALAGVRSPPPPASGGLARLDGLASAARVAVPGSMLVALTAVADARAQAELRTPDGMTAVALDRQTGAVLDVGTATNGAWDLVRRLHYGDFAGWLSRVAWVLAGLALPALTITGYLAATRPRASS